MLLNIVRCHSVHMDKFLVKLLIRFSEIQVFVLYPRMLPLIIERGRPEAINIGAAMWGIALDYNNSRLESLGPC